MYVQSDSITAQHVCMCIVMCMETLILLQTVPALRVGKVGSRLGSQDLEGPQMPEVGPQTYWQTCLIVMNIGGDPTTASRAKL